jgi:hypothetical protein
LKNSGEKLNIGHHPELVSISIITLMFFHDFLFLKRVHSWHCFLLNTTDSWIYSPDDLKFLLYPQLDPIIFMMGLWFLVYCQLSTGMTLRFFRLSILLSYFSLSLSLSLNKIHTTQE